MCLSALGLWQARIQGLGQEANFCGRRGVRREDTFCVSELRKLAPEKKQAVMIWVVLVVVVLGMSAVPAQAVSG